MLCFVSIIPLAKEFNALKRRNGLWVISESNPTSANKSKKPWTVESTDWWTSCWNTTGLTHIIFQSEQRDGRRKRDPTFLMRLTAYPSSVSYPPLSWYLIRTESTKVPPCSCSIFFMKGSSVVALKTRVYVTLTSWTNTHREKYGMLRTYHDVVKYLLCTYATADVIAETDATATRYTQPPAMSLCPRHKKRQC